MGHFVIEEEPQMNYIEDLHEYDEDNQTREDEEEDKSQEAGSLLASSIPNNVSIHRPRNIQTVFDENSFEFKLTIDGSCYHTEVLIASAAMKNGGMPVPLHCTWYNVIPTDVKGKDEFRLIEQVSSSAYQPSIEDIGHK